MDDITDPKLAALIRRGLADEQVYAKLMRDLFSRDEQVLMRALESFARLFLDKMTDSSDDCL
jgi:hypothetical protein